MMLKDNKIMLKNINREIYYEIFIIMGHNNSLFSPKHRYSNNSYPRVKPL